MVNIKPFLFPAISSLVCGILVFLFFFIFQTPGASGNGCIILAVDESLDDLYVREALDELGLGSFISESSQEVYIDNFGELKSIPLEIYNDEVNYFDPRNDGYASLLSSFFVRDGLRYFYLPLESKTGIRTADLTRKLGVIFYDTPFQLAVIGEMRPHFLFMVFYATACLLVFFFSRSKKLFVYKLPVLLALGLSGPPAFIMAAALIGIWELLREPLIELLAMHHNKRWQSDYAGRGMGLPERIWPFRLNLILVVFLFLFLIVYIFMGEFPVFPAVFGIICFFGLYYPVLKVEKKRVQDSRHMLFTPILLHPLKTKTFHLFPLLLPLGFFHVFFTSLVLPNYSPPMENNVLFDNTKAYIVKADDFYRHINYQNTFSYVPFGRETIIQDGYYRYYIDEDGLISGVWEYYNNEREIMPFPLEDLMVFLENYHENRVPTAGNISYQGGINYVFHFWEWIFSVLIISICSLDLLRPWIRYKRITA